jgi:TonB-dependent Receptor Plug Domain/CarboxypepD_reg-like domain
VIFLYHNRFCAYAVVFLLLFLLRINPVLQGQSNLLLQKIDLTCKNCTPADAILNIYRNTGINISFSNDFFTNCPPITIEARQQTIETIIHQITKGCNDLLLTPGINEIILSLRDRNVTISGHIQDIDNNEKVIGASVVIRQKGIVRKAVSNEYGFYSLSIISGKCNIEVTYPGYDTLKLYLNPSQDLKNDIKITPWTKTLGDVEIIRVNSIPTTWTVMTINGANIVPNQVLTSLPSLAGEGDLMRSITQIPGIQTGVDGIGGIHIRGGNTDQNLILLDDVPVYNPSHVVGLLSIFSPKTTKNVRLWKGDFPARYGGRTSSVIDVRTRDGSNKEFKGGVDLNLMSISSFVEGPTPKNKGSFLVGARHSLFGSWLQLASKRPNVLNVKFDQLVYKVHDYNVKVNQRIGINDELFFSFYSGKDNFDAPFAQTSSVENLGSFFDNYNLNSDWGNKIFSLRWNHIWGSKIFSNTTASRSNFIYRSQLNRKTEFVDLLNRSSIIANYSQLYLTDINDLSLRSDFTYFPHHRLTLTFGGAATNHQFKPGALSFNFQLPGQTSALVDSLSSGLLKNNNIAAMEWEGYSAAQWEFLPRFHFCAGMNISAFNITNKIYKSFLPRLRIYHGNEEVGFKQWVSHNYMAQYLHQIGSFNIGLPFELWVPSTEQVLPERAVQTAIGFGWSNKAWGFTLEAYKKDMNRVVILRSEGDALITAGADDANGWENRIITGKGQSRGIECMLERKTGNIRGVISYTLSKSTRQFDDLNLGRPFLFQFDRTHDFKINVSYYLNKCVDFSANWVFMSGTPITLAGVKYNFQSLDNPTGQKDVLYYSDLNGYRLPPNHRLDLSLNLNFNHLIRSIPIQHVLQLGAYNTYNRANPFYLVIDINSGKPNRAIQYTLLPILPSIRYAMTF